MTVLAVPETLNAVHFTTISYSMRVDKYVSLINVGVVQKIFPNDFPPEE